MRLLDNKSLTEEQIIAHYFNKPSADSSVAIGIGDDAAIINVNDECLAITTDTLVEDIHFNAKTNANYLGHKTLAVNLSDLAAMGSTPHWALLALTMPNTDEHWLADFSDGFFSLANAHSLSLIGGDTTRGVLTITVQLIGSVVENRILRRDNAQAGEGIYVTGSIADTALAALFEDSLKPYRQSYKQCSERMLRPVPRVAEGMILARYAKTATDISDGIFKDLSRILSASDVGAEIDLNRIPTIPEIDALCPTLESLLNTLTYGEDYELLFTLEDNCLAELTQAFKGLGTKLTRIGTISKEPGLRCYYHSELIELPGQLGYDHFS